MVKASLSSQPFCLSAFMIKLPKSLAKVSQMQKCAKVPFFVFFLVKTTMFDNNDSSTHRHFGMKLMLIMVQSSATTQQCSPACVGLTPTRMCLSLHRKLGAQLTCCKCDHAASLLPHTNTTSPRFSGAQHHHYLLNFLRNMAERYHQEHRAANLVVDLLKLEVPKLFAVDRGEEKDKKVRNEFSLFLQEYIRQGNLKHIILEKMRVIMVREAICSDQILHHTQKWNVSSLPGCNFR